MTTTEPKYKTDQKPRITIYCNNEEQKERLSARLEILKNKFSVKTNVEVIEYLVIQEIEFLKRHE